MNNYTASSNLQSYFNRMEIDFENLFKFVSQFSNEELNTRPEPKAWSALQVMHHLILSERGSLDYLKKKVYFGPNTLKKASAASRLRAMLLVTSLKQPIKLSAPAVASEGLPEQTTLQETEQLWRTIRREIRDFLSQQNEDILNSDCFKHPITGKMSAWGMLDFFEVHFSRHFKQIKTTIRKVESHD
jgi:uncharacterized damage-inducible protein DinB